MPTSLNSQPRPKAVPDNNPIPFAVEPAEECYWPIVTSGPEGRLVSYEAQEGKIIGNKYRRFLADRPVVGTSIRYHVAIDLYANINDPVYACQAGKIINFKYFYKAETGDKTFSLLLQHAQVIINYGEVSENSLDQTNLKIGDFIKAGQHVGFISATKMLHFETYETDKGNSNTQLPQRWMKKDANPPASLLNPTKYLLFLATNGLIGKEIINGGR